MPVSQEIKIMISSRCKDDFSVDEPTSLTEIRRKLKCQLEGTTIFGIKCPSGRFASHLNLLARLD